MNAVILTDNYATPDGRRVRTRDRLLVNEIMPSDVATRRSENNKKSYFHCRVKIMNAVIFTVQ